MTRRQTTDTDNGYRVSTIDYGYGSGRGLYESAIIHDGELCYATAVTDNVAGWQTDDDVTAFRAAVRYLPRNDKCGHRRPETS